MNLYVLSELGHSSFEDSLRLTSIKKAIDKCRRYICSWSAPQIHLFSKKDVNPAMKNHGYSCASENSLVPTLPKLC